MAMSAAVAAMAVGGGLQAKGAIDAGKAQGRASTNFLSQQTQLLRQQQLDNKAAQDKIAEQQAKQQQLRDQAGAVGDAVITANSRPAQDAAEADAVAKRNMGYQTIANLHPVAIDVGNSANAPSIVGDAIAKSIASAKAYGDNQAKAKAAIEGFGDLTTNNQLTLKDNADTIRTLGTENDVSTKLAQQQKDYMSTLAGITNNQITTAGTGVNSRLEYDKAQAGNYSTIGDILFKAGSMGAGAAGGAGTTAGTPMSGGAQGPTQGTGFKGWATR